jgi:hypothetical protein
VLDLAEAEFYLDFYLLSQCDIVAISNSSFSFAACMLSETGKFFFRPDWSTEKLIPFDPWNSEPLLWENPKKLNSDSIPEEFKLNDVQFLLTNYHLSDEEFLQAAYRKYLLRYPDEAGKQWYIKLLADKSITRRTILAGMQQSVEFKWVWEPIASASEEETYWHMGAQWAKQAKWDEAIAAYHQAIQSKSRPRASLQSLGRQSSHPEPTRCTGGSESEIFQSLTKSTRLSRIIRLFRETPSSKGQGR